MNDVIPKAECCPYSHGLKRFLKLKQLLTEEQLIEVKEKLKRVSPGFQKITLVMYNASICQCGDVASRAAIFDYDGCNLIEKYCNDCISRECRIRQPDFNVFNFDQFLNTIPEYRETLRKRYEELGARQ